MIFWLDRFSGDMSKL